MRMAMGGWSALWGRVRAIEARAIELGRRLGQSGLDEALELLATPRCALCSLALESGLFCAEHALPARPEGPRCGRCDRALPPGFPDQARCRDCRLTPRGPWRTLAVGDYRGSGGLRACVLALKHGGRRDLAVPLGALLAQRWLFARDAHRLGERMSRSAPGQAAPSSPEPSLGLAACLVPVPLHPFRRWERGYDQAELLARSAAAQLGIDVVPALYRLRDSAPQGSPTAASRQANVRGIFGARARQLRRVANREVWLIDDVATSGATLEQCTLTLKKAGAARVGALVLAHAGSPSD